MSLGQTSQPLFPCWESCWTEAEGSGWQVTAEWHCRLPEVCWSSSEVVRTADNITCDCYQLFGHISKNCSWSYSFVSPPIARDIPSRKDLGFFLLVEFLNAFSLSHPWSLTSSPISIAVTTFITYGLPKSLLIYQTNKQNFEKLNCSDLGSSSQGKLMCSRVLTLTHAATLNT